MEILLITTSFIAFIFGLGEILVKNKSEKNTLLSIIFFIATYYLFHSYLLHSGLIHSSRILFLTTTPLLAALGPISERYFFLLLEDRRIENKTFLYRFIPTANTTLLLIPFYFRDMSKDIILNEFGRIHIENIPIFVKLGVFIALSSLFYFFLSPIIRIIRVISLHSLLEHNRSRIVFFMSLFCTFIVPSMTIFFLFFNRTSAHIFISLTCGFFICIIYLLKQRYPDFFEEFRSEIEFEKKLRKSKISHLNLESIQEKLNFLFAEKKIFLNEKLTLGDLAKELNITNHQLSEYLNTIQNIQFYPLLNQYRVEEAKKNIEYFPKKTFLQIALESGFNSKSNFNQVFKQITGTTPSEFKKNLSKANDLDDSK